MLTKRVKFLGLLILIFSLAITMTACDIGDSTVDEVTEEEPSEIDFRVSASTFKEQLSLTEEQSKKIEKETGVLKLTEKQVESIKEPVEQMLDEAKGTFSESKWQEIKSIYDPILTKGEADLQKLNELAEDLYNKSLTEAAAYTNFKKLSDEVNVLSEKQPDSQKISQSSIIYTPANSDEGEQNFIGSMNGGGTSGVGNKYKSGANSDSGALGVWTDAGWPLSANAIANQTIEIEVPSDNTNLKITAIINYQSGSTISGPGAAVGIDVIYRDLIDREIQREAIVSPLGWDSASETVALILQQLFPKAIAFDYEHFAYMSKIEEYGALVEALDIEGVSEKKEITYYVDSLDKGVYHFDVGFQATAVAPLGEASAFAIGQVSKIEVEQDNGEEIVEFEDPNLEEVVREEINKPEGTLYKSDVIDITVLDAQGRGIESIEGIQHLNNLNFLDLGLNYDGNDWHYNKISDISPLSELINLDWLDLSYNEISDISVLSNLTNLEFLAFTNNKVSNINPLKNLTNLEYLAFSRNEVSDISAVANLTNLEELWFYHNKINVISALSDLTNLKRLTFYRNEVSDLDALKNLTNLRSLHFSGNEVSDINSLANLTNLVRLFFFSNEVSDISPLENLTNLEELYFRDNEVSDISPLVRNESFGPDDFIDMRWNNLDLTEGSEDMENINALIDRGVDVKYEPNW